MVLVMFALMMSEDRYSKRDRYLDIIQGLKELPDKIKKVLELDNQIHEMAKGMKDQKSVLVMGRGYNFATCLEGALVSNSNDSYLGLPQDSSLEWKSDSQFIFLDENPCTLIRVLLEMPLELFGFDAT